MKLLIAFILLAGVCFGQDLSPNGKYDNIVNHSYYSLSYAEPHEQAEWVMYSLQGSALNGSVASIK